MQKTRETNFAELTRRALLQSFAPASVVTDLKGEHPLRARRHRQIPAPGARPGHASTSSRWRARACSWNCAPPSTPPSQGKPTVGQEVSVKTNGGVQTREPQRAPVGRPGGRAEPAAGELPGRGDAGARGKRRRAQSAPPDPPSPGASRNWSASWPTRRRTSRPPSRNSRPPTKNCKSTNEELQSTNEELQSTNEELETSKEELQSRQRGADHRQCRIAGQDRAARRMQNDMKNLLDNINVGHHLPRPAPGHPAFTREAAQVYRLVATDVGRPWRDIKSQYRGRRPARRAAGRARFPGAARARGATARRRLVPGAHPALPDAGQRHRRRGADLHRHHRKRVAAEAGGQRGAATSPRASSIRCANRCWCWMASCKSISASRSFYRHFQTSPERHRGPPDLRSGQPPVGHPGLARATGDHPAAETRVSKATRWSTTSRHWSPPHAAQCPPHRRRAGDTQMILLAMEEASPGPAREAAA